MICYFGLVFAIIPLVEGYILVPGASGYIGRQVVKELVSRGLSTISLVRSLELSNVTEYYLQGSDKIVCDCLDPQDVDRVFSEYRPSAVVCCLASRSGVGRDSWLVDYHGGLNMLKSLTRFGSHNAIESSAASSSHFVLLSAFCCGKPLLQFQYAKLKLESEIKSQKGVTHSIVRPTAFFKSVDGQLDSVSKGNPFLFFGDGSCAANAISESDLSKFLADCATRPQAIGMLDSTRNVGGPDNPPITKRQQGQLIFNTLGISAEKRRFISIPLGVLDFMVAVSEFLKALAEVLRFAAMKERFEDASEIVRIIKYYASEPMVAVGEGEIQGGVKLADHFTAITKQGGTLQEIDKMTTTAGILEVFAKNDYVK